MHTFLSVEYAPELRGHVLFSTESSRVFREEGDILPLPVGDRLRVIPWGADNRMPYDIMRLVDEDETVATCMSFTQEVAFGAGLRYAPRADRLPGRVEKELEDFMDSNRLDEIWMGQCADMKMFDFCVCVLILNADGKRIERVVRKHAAYCRFGEADASGRIPHVVYANWRNAVGEADCEVVPLIRPDCPLRDLRARLASDPKARKFAMVSMVPKAGSTYYPIPAWASLFRSDWYDIKRLIGKAKKAKLKNSAPIKYHIEVDDEYWTRAFRRAGITDPVKKKEHEQKLKRQMIDFLSGAENSGKVLFSSTIRTPDGREVPEVKVTKISSDEKEGGDYTTDIQEAVNMICFTMRVHSNLVGSVPGKAQSNNSGSDKRELYTIAQTLQKPYHSIMLTVHDLVCRFNGWSRHVRPTVDIIQLTTLDKHTDAKTV